jgi:hypothetical protein
VEEWFFYEGLINPNYFYDPNISKCKKS